MKQYIGTKTIQAAPMTRDEAEAMWGRSIGGERTGDGYLVTYPDGYESWSPKDVFEAAYRVNGQLTFADAMYCLSEGYEVYRTGWNGKGMTVFKPSGDVVLSNANSGDSRLVGIKPAYLMLGTDQQLAIWAPSQSDMTATDWCFVEDSEG